MKARGRESRAMELRWAGKATKGPGEGLKLEKLELGKLGRRRGRPGRCRGHGPAGRPEGVRSGTRV